jgi:hypothetical protein
MSTILTSFIFSRNSILRTTWFYRWFHPSRRDLYLENAILSALQSPTPPRFVCWHQTQADDPRQTTAVCLTWHSMKFLELFPVTHRNINSWRQDDITTDIKKTWLFKQTDLGIVEPRSMFDICQFSRSINNVESTGSKVEWNITEEQMPVLESDECGTADNSVILRSITQVPL